MKNMPVFSIVILCILSLNIMGCDKTLNFSVKENDVTSGFKPTKLQNINSDSIKVYSRNNNLGRGMNFGNALEAPNEGEWGLTIHEKYIQELADAGFNSVRLPICWSAHTLTTPPYTINETFLLRVEEIVNWCLTRDLSVIITIHHFNDFYDNPDNTNLQNWFYAIWKQLCSRFGNKDHEKLLFEVLNEPHNSLTAEKWNAIIPHIIDTVRVYDKDRTIIIDVPDYAYHGSLSKLIIPNDRQNIIVSVRYYIPYEFTHQGAHWVTGSDAWLGQTWTSTTSQKNIVISDMDKIKQWSDTYKRPVNIGEFGAIINADASSRLIWTGFVTRSFENYGFSWCYFDFGVLFKAYDIGANQWLNQFKETLVPLSTGIREVQ